MDKKWTKNGQEIKIHPSDLNAGGRFFDCNFFEFWLYFKIYSDILLSKKRAMSLVSRQKESPLFDFACQISRGIKEDEKVVYNALIKLKNLKLIRFKSNYLIVRGMNKSGSTKNLTKKSRFNFKKELLKLECDPQHVDDWMIARKNKKASNTKTSFNSFVAECENNNILVPKAVQICAQRGWSGFKYKWLKTNKEYEPTINRQSKNTIISNREGWHL